MSLFRSIFLVALLAFGTAQADTLKMTGASGGDARPSRGMTQAKVESTYGSPVSVQAPVGDPPITRWEYQNFIVYFEYDKVIHAVTKR